MTILFLSDAHLDASSLAKERELCRLLDHYSQKLDTLIILGDMFDFWFSYRHLVPKGGIRLLGKLAELADHGVRILYFTGNHDMWIFDYLEKEIGVEMYNDPAEITLDGRKILIGHGDGLGHLDKHYDFLRMLFRSRICQKLFTILPSRLTFGIAHRWSAHSKHSHSENDLTYLGDEREGIVRYCKERLMSQSFDYCIFAHRHTPLLREIKAPNGRTSLYANSGDWLTHRSYLLMKDGLLELLEWVPEDAL